VPIDDNQRLGLKEYRNLIYDEIRRKSKSLVDINNSTLYRIKQTVRKSHPKKAESSDHKTIPLEEEQVRKKSFYNRNPLLSKGRHLKTIEKEWDPTASDPKKATLYNPDKLAHTRFDYEWSRKKRSTTEANHTKKASRVLPSPAELKHKYI
jgi:hypothetical protein